jgi:hypothetical protein
MGFREAAFETVKVLGFAAVDDDGVATGWSMMGDGSEPWSMGDQPPGSGHPTQDELFRRVSALLAFHQRNQATS